MDCGLFDKMDLVSRESKPLEDRNGSSFFGNLFGRVADHPYIEWWGEPLAVSQLGVYPRFQEGREMGIYDRNSYEEKFAGLKRMADFFHRMERSLSGVLSEGSDGTLKRTPRTSLVVDVTPASK
jgi:hypothetical protein